MTHPMRCKHGSKTKDGKTVCLDIKGCDYQRWEPDCRTLLFCCASHSDASFPIPNDEQCRICQQSIQQNAVNKVLDEVIATWREWHSEGFERPIQRETVVKVFEKLRTQDE